MRWLERVATGQTPGPRPAVAAVKTYRYLRLAMVAMVLGLAVAVGHEVLRVEGNCWQTSLSGYYYTPVQNLFVGALVAIGVCLVSLKGNTDSEDVLLNFAGLCAPFVALVPIHDPSACGVVTDGLNRDLNIANNVAALLAVFGAALVALAALWWHNRRTATTSRRPPGSRSWGTRRRSWSSSRRSPCSGCSRSGSTGTATRSPPSRCSPSCSSTSSSTR